MDFLVARGGMGEVWAATHVSLDRRVALKLIAKPLAASTEARARFDAEAKSVASLVSRFVVRIFDNGQTDDGVPYIAMEYLEGESLEARLERLECLGLPEVVRIIGQVGKALDHAHGRGIVHRDLKPENVFLSRSFDGEKEVAKVLDFGVAKVMSEDGSKVNSLAGSVLGTPLFMSPEQARGYEIDGRSDLYSLGMLAFNMLTGAYAFSRDSIAEVLAAICAEPLPRIRDLQPWAPPALDHWFARACARDPNRRFQSGAEMAEALRIAAQQPRSALSTTSSSGEVEPTPAGDSTAPVTAVRSGRPSTGAFIVLSAAALAAILLTAGVAATAAHVARSEPGEPMRRGLAAPAANLEPISLPEARVEPSKPPVESTPDEADADAPGGEVAPGGARAPRRPSPWKRPTPSRPVDVGF